ncbi:Cof-type HAD-IIB family hydrolase [Ulvibacterium marinum]|uniref:HAD family phosphatase n=1 Tax=Ulvibacterium marinum TaxID=2419782 RepID=A0A3B0C2K3_9FLAO|nr:Cof-type HAD-IIB family hydrolase [Ulvibacterium marinum]RKN77967.1 HAD family phosphatase [Ulvibacterium marinum]
MKYKAIFIDVDGTLLTDELIISSGTKEVLGKLNKQGILISIVTARPPGASLPYYNELGVTENPIICFNGALIMQNNMVLHEEVIGAMEIMQIINEVKNFNINISLYKHHDWYTNQIDYWIKQEVQITHAKVTKIDFDLLISSNFYANKLLLMGQPFEISNVETHLKNIGFDYLNIHKSKPTYLEIMNNSASKSRGIEGIIKVLDITADEIITIGDNFNDIDMFLLARTSIAMGNAPEEVKKYATIVTDNNNSDGIRKALNNLIKK